MELNEKELKFLQKQKKMMNLSPINHPLWLFLIITGYSSGFYHLYSGTYKDVYLAYTWITLYLIGSIVFMISIWWTRFKIINQLMKIVEKLYTEQSGEPL